MKIRVKVFIDELDQIETKLNKILARYSVITTNFVDIKIIPITEKRVAVVIIVKV